MTDATGSGVLRLVLGVVVGLVALAGVACGGGDDGDGDGDGKGSGARARTSSTLTFEQRDAALQLNLAATGMNLVASDVGLRSVRGEGVEYCRTEAPDELKPHRAVLAASTDAEVRRLAEVALGELDKAVTSCAEGADASAVQEAIDRYNASFEPLRRRIDALVAPAG